MVVMKRLAKKFPTNSNKGNNEYYFIALRILRNIKELFSKKIVACGEEWARVGSLLALDWNGAPEHLLKAGYIPNVSYGRWRNSRAWTMVSRL